MIASLLAAGKAHVQSTTLKRQSHFDPELLVDWLKTSSGKALYDFRAENHIGWSALIETIRDSEFQARIDKLFPNGDPCCPECGSRPVRLTFGLMKSKWEDNLTPPLLYDWLAGRLQLGGCVLSDNLMCRSCGRKWSTNWPQEASQMGARKIADQCTMGDWQSLPPYPGIYEITTPDGPYLGQSQDIRKRIGHHLDELGKGVHKNCRLQRVYDRVHEQVLGHEQNSNEGGDWNNLQFSEPIKVRTAEMAPVTLTGDALTTWLLRREAYWILEKGGDILNIEFPKVPPFDFDKFARQKWNAEWGIRRLPDQIESARRELLDLEERTRAEVDALEPKILAAAEKLEKERIKGWIYLGVISAAGFTISLASQNYSPFVISVAVAAWFKFVGPVSGASAREGLGRLFAEKQSKHRAVDEKRGKLSKMRERLSRAKRDIKRICEEETIFFAE